MKNYVESMAGRGRIQARTEHRGRIDTAARQMLSALLIAVAAGLAGPAAAGAEALKDMRGREITRQDSSRIVSIGSAVTEILYALGVGDGIVAVDTTSTYPAAANAKAKVGYMRALAPEGVLSLSPSVIIAVEGSGPPDAIAALEAGRVPVVLVPDAKSPEGVVRKIRIIAAAIGKVEEGEAVAKAVEADFAALARIVAAVKAERKAMFVLALRDGAPLVAGDDTTADAMMRFARVDNAFHEIKGYKPVSGEAVLAAAPEAVIFMREREHDFNGAEVFKGPVFAATPAARNNRAIAMGGVYLLGFGPRTPHAARDLAAAIYPELSLPALPERAWTKDSGKP